MQLPLGVWGGARQKSGEKVGCGNSSALGAIGGAGKPVERR